MEDQEIVCPEESATNMEELNDEVLKTFDEVRKEVEQDNRKFLEREANILLAKLISCISYNLASISVTRRKKM